MADDHEVQSAAEDAVPVESLIKGRAKRSTAGRLMSSLLDAEADDDLALLFEEIEDDNEFDAAADEEGAEEDDMGMDSSSDDDDDQGPNARADDFEGEKQIEKEEKAEKKKRRAQQDLRFKIASKKVKIDPTAVPAAPDAAPPRPKKKSERISWIPTPDEGPTRSSSRRQTMQNKELTHARLKDSEEKRVRLIATMEEAAKRKAHLKPKEMTQAERLAEAERVERHNSKSLNRWEEMEKRKAEERRAKIEALQNRRLEGPVMSYWSGLATWVNGRITRLGKVDVTPKPEKEENARRKSKKLEKEGKNVTEQKPTEDATAAESATSQTAPPPTSESAANPAPPEGELVKQDGDTPQAQPTSNEPSKEGGENASADAAANPAPAAPSAATNQSSTLEADNAQVPETSQEAQAGDDVAKEQQKETDPAETRTEKPAQVEAEVTKPSEKAEEPSEEPAKEAQVSSPPPNEITSKPDQPAKQEQAPAEEKSDEASKAVVSEPAASTNAVSEDATAAKAASPTAPDTTPAVAAAAQPDQQAETPAPAQESPAIHVDQTATANEDIPQPEVPQPPPVIEQTGRSLTVLENFDDKTAQSKEFSIYFNAKKPPRLTKISSSLCVITSLPSRYRDPETSLPFANAYAYNEIRHTVAQKYAWSPMLGCYVGPTQVAARGVPERFLGGPQAASEGKDSEQKESGGNAEPAPTEKDKEGDTNHSGDAPSASKPAPPATPTPVTADAGDPMEVD